MNDKPAGALALKLARILGEVGKVPKSGHNAFHKYDYVTENDLVYAVRDKLSAAGVFVFSSVEEQRVETIKDEDKSFFLTTVTTLHTFIDGDSGDSFSVRSQGQGSDSGDKGGYKAITGAMKYFLYKCFMIPTGDDPEADTKTDERAAQPRRETAPMRSTPVEQLPPARQEKLVDKPSTQVPRTGATISERSKFEGGEWQKVVIHFGKQKGLTLGEIPDKSLGWWIHQWQPKPFNGSIDEDAKMLRAALDAAALDVEKK